MIPGGWNRLREAINTQKDPGPVKGTLEEEMNPGGSSEITKYYIWKTIPGRLHTIVLFVTVLIDPATT